MNVDPVQGGHSLRRSGFTVAETVVATLLVGGLCVVALDTAGAAISASVRVADETRATLLAQELLSEILLQEYADPDLPTTTLGPDPGESGGARLNWDDVDDYNGWSAFPPENRYGTKHTELANWKRTVSVDWVTGSDLSVVSNVETNIKRIIVAVEHNEVELAKLTALKTVGLPPPDPVSNILLVVTDVMKPGVNETARQTLIESWGFTVTLIADSAPATDFQTASAGAVAAYVSTDISAINLGTKLSSTTIGVVNENADLADEFGFCSKVATASSTDIVTVDDIHYITSPFVAWSATTIYTSSQPVFILNGTIASGLTPLGGLRQGALVVYSFSAMDIGVLGFDNVAVAGRRVMLPWGGTGFDFSLLNATGQTMMKRSIEWAGGLSTP